MTKQTFVFLLSVILISCQGGKSSDATKTQAQQQAPSQGGADVGGSNDYMGKPMESYIVDVKTLPEFQEHLVPVLDQLEQKLPRFHKLLTASIEGKRSWYLVPGDLQSIPNATIAFPFLNKTDQYALHTEKAIWLSSEKREQSKDSRLRAIHILHEMVMAVKVDGNKRLRLITDKDFVTQKEYEEIRSAVSILMNNLDSYSSEQLNQFMYDNKFYLAHETLDLIEMHPYDTLPVSYYDFDSAAEFFTYADHIRFAKSRKRYGLPEIENTPTIPNYCTYQLDLFRSLKVETFDPYGKKIADFGPGRPANFPNWMSRSDVEFTEMVSFVKHANGARSVKMIGHKKTVGPDREEAVMSHMYFLGDDLLYIEIFEASKEPGLEWSQKSIPNGYILCVNRNLQ